MRRLTRTERAAVAAVAAKMDHPTAGYALSSIATKCALAQGGPRISDSRRHAYVRAVWRIAADRETFVPPVPR